MEWQFPKEKGIKKENRIPNENLFFKNTEVILVSKQEIKDLKVRLENSEINSETRSVFESSRQFYKRLKEKGNIIFLKEFENM